MSHDTDEDSNDNTLLAWPRRRDLNSYLCEACRSLDEMGRKEFGSTDSRRQFVTQKLVALREKGGSFVNLVRDDTLDVNGALVNSFTVTVASLAEGGYLSAAPYFFMRELALVSYFLPLYLLSTGVEGAVGSQIGLLQGGEAKWAAAGEERRVREMMPIAVARLRCAHGEVDAFLRALTLLEQQGEAGVEAAAASAGDETLFPNTATHRALPPLTDMIIDLFSSRDVAVPSNDDLTEIQDLVRSFAHPALVHRMQPDMDAHVRRLKRWTPFASHVDTFVSHVHRSIHLYAFGWWCLHTAEALVARVEDVHGGDGAAVALECADMLVTCVSTVCVLAALRSIGYSDGGVHVRDALEAMSHHEEFATLQAMTRSYECGPYFEFMVGEGEAEDEWIQRLSLARVLHAPDAAAVIAPLRKAFVQAELALRKVEEAFPVSLARAEGQQMRFAMRSLLAKGVAKRVAKPMPTSMAEYLVPARFAAHVHPPPSRAATAQEEKAGGSWWMVALAILALVPGVIALGWAVYAHRRRMAVASSINRVGGAVREEER